MSAFAVSGRNTSKTLTFGFPKPIWKLVELLASLVVDHSTPPSKQSGSTGSGSEHVGSCRGGGLGAVGAPLLSPAQMPVTEYQEPDVRWACCVALPQTKRRVKASRLPAGVCFCCRTYGVTVV